MDTQGNVEERQRIRVVIADDHAVVRAGLRSLLGTEADIIVIGEADNGLIALQMAKDLVPDVLIVDMEMPGLRGTEVARHLRADRSSVRVLMLSAYTSQQYVLGILGSGAAGYLLKEEAPDNLVDAVRRVCSGGYWLSPHLTARVAKTLQGNAQAPETLTEQERRILRLIVAGKTNEGISDVLGMPAPEVEKHLEHVFAKLDVTTRVEAAVLAVQQEIV